MTTPATINRPPVLSASGGDSSGRVLSAPACATSQAEVFQELKSQRAAHSSKLTANLAGGKS